jgi:hypothetical protein
MAKIGVEKGKPKNDGSGENYADKNVLAAVITPDKAGWHPVTQVPSVNGGGNGSAAAPGSPSSSGAPPSGNPPIPPPNWAR